LLFFILRIIIFGAPHRPPAMGIKLDLDTEKTAKAAVAIASAFGLCQVSESTFPQLAAANALALILIVVILYGPRPAPKSA
jgi:hypothetical protein